jgi:hypothetical protein
MFMHQLLGFTSFFLPAWAKADSPTFNESQIVQSGEAESEAEGWADF